MVELIRLAGPFDEHRRGAATPATPTCCCCCCCLVTTLTASTVAAVKVHREAELAGKSATVRWLAVVVAALAVVAAYPMIVLLAVVGDAVAGDPPGWLAVIAFVLVVLATWLLMVRLAFRVADAPGHGAWKWSGLFVGGTAFSFTAELMSAGFLFWGQLAAIPVAIGAGIVLRRRLVARR